MNTPLQIKDFLKKSLIGDNDVLAAWEGGSVATGFQDEYSDLDLTIVVNNGSVESVFSLIDTLLSSEYGIIKRLRIPEPTWHKMSQTFYLLQNTPELYYLDIVLAEKDNPNKLIEADRHGTPLIWFDRDGVYNLCFTPEEEIVKTGKRLFKISTSVDFITIIELKKALQRNNWIAAQANYHQFINRHLILMMNLKFRREKADFGIRYADREYPQEYVTVIENLIRIKSVDDIGTRLPEALSLYHSLKKELSCIWG